MEKLLKSVYALLGYNIPKLHYIDELARQLGLSQDVMDNVIDLSSDYSLFRYPDTGVEASYEQYNLEIAIEKVEKAKRVFEVLMDKYDLMGAQDDEPS